MALSYVAYDLQDGYIMNWLAAGPQAIRLTDLTNIHDSDIQLQVARQFYETKNGIVTTPVERGPLNEGVFKIGDYEGHWEYYHCREDHFVDHSTSLDSGYFVRSWAYTQLTSPADQAAHFILTSYGPADVWVNKKHVCHYEQFTRQPASVSFDADIQSGKNQVLIRFAGIAAPECRLAVGLRLSPSGSQGAEGVGGPVGVQIPTLIPSLSRRNELEAVNQLVYLDRDVYAADDQIVLTWPDSFEKSAYNDVRLQTPSGRIYGQAEDIGEPGSQRILGSGASVPAGPFRALIMPRAWEFYESNIRITGALDCWVMGLSRFSDGPHGTLEERRLDALRRAASREGDLFADIASAALARQDPAHSFEPDRKVLANALESIAQRKPGSELLLLGLLGLLARLDSGAGLPADLVEQVKAAALGYRYWMDEPGADLLDFSEADGQIIFHTCEILAGQQYPDSSFASGGLTGEQHRRKGETLALAWIQARGQQGFADWDSKESYAQILAALAHLIDFAESEPVFELASVLLDKLLFSLALNSYKGVFGSVQRRARTATIKSGLLEETSGVSRLLWGMGVFNQHISATVSMACMQNYELPPVIADIAAGLPEELWGREQQASDGKPSEGTAERGAAGQLVNKVTYRTPDYMLCSAQDYRPGQPGEREHIWQATMSPQSIVFVTHPGNASENEAHAPNYWLGNAVLPRVAQWKDTLIALYRLPVDDRMGFTHAYFPTRSFDEYALRGNTAFARVGSAYLALTAASSGDTGRLAVHAAQGLEMVTVGRTAFRELRSYGKQAIWVCQMGRANTDGDFNSFQEKVLAQAISFGDLSVQLQSLRGDTISFGWDAPLLLNGEAQPLEGFKHYENPFTSVELPCKEMEIKTEEYLLRLHFAELPN